MRGDPEGHELVAASSLDEVLARLADGSGEWMPIAGGTELMVAHAAGRLSARKLVNIWGLRELSFVRVDDDTISIGAGVTFGEIRRNPIIASEFPLLAQAAGWIGAIANQNRATLGGNIVNGSPAADAPPALLVYDAEIELISHRGVRRFPYCDFHLGYKQSVLERDELVLALHLPRRFSQHAQYLRKVGTRRAMAITTAIIEAQLITEIRLAAASVADRPIRLLSAESALLGNLLTDETVTNARLMLLDEVKPIDDIRSTAAYRKHVAANLLDEFLNGLIGTDSKGMSA
jgi:CO/xanthine dehydrogenase FAD-binding subunit